MNEQQVGLIQYTTPGNITDPVNSTGVRLFKSSADGQYYIKYSDGTVELFTAALTGTPYLVGPWDASVNSYPLDGAGSGPGGQILKGNTWLITVAGTLNGVAVEAGDELVSLITDPGQIGANWFVLEKNLGYVPENVVNKATDFSVINNVKYPTTQAIENRLAGLNEVFRYERVLTRAELIALDVTPITITEIALGLTGGQKAKFHQLDTEWHVHPDGVAFTQTAPLNIILKTTTGATAITHLPMSEVVGSATDLVVQSNGISAGLGSAAIIRIAPNASFYLEAVGGTIGGGGANADVTVVLFYEKITI